MTDNKLNADRGKTTVYSWIGPPRITVSTKSVVHNGKQWMQHVVEGDEGGVGVVAVATHNGRHLLVEHFRPATNETLTEFPRGFGMAPSPGSTPEQQACIDAKRELLEETGIVANSAAFLGYIWPDSGILGNKVAVVGIEAKSEHPSSGTDGEIDGCQWATHQNVRMGIRTGRISDGITLAAYSLWCASAI